ncbi:MAG: UDP-glucose--hexose-1-phosphate uridylyltransferase [Fretibacterium sp.]|nr:UDP-glucose--hexose-1-phosphate uridylyltransferase [Fretibacterium sp.]
MPERDLNRLLNFALKRGLIAREDVAWAANGLIEVLGLTSFERRIPSEEEFLDLPDLPDALLEPLLDWAEEQGLIDGTMTERDLLDTRLMGCLTPRPSEVSMRFEVLRARSPGLATDYLHELGIASNYIRKARVDRNLRWKTPSEFGELDITINLSKPEKDPREIAAARNAPQSRYPKCLLCRENEGFCGGLTHPARQNLRLIPMDLAGRSWFFQYSPYAYYNEHCIILSERHEPMRISRETFENLLAFLDVLPHYFAGSNADLPIVGGSILSHDHYQGGRYCFAMERAPVERQYDCFEGASCGRVKWPMSALRLQSESPEPLIEASTRVLEAWRGYSDESVEVLAFSDGKPHNTITPIARLRDGRYEMDLVLRNNRTSPQHPLGIFHPHAEQHHIKKENIGLIEVMGLAVLPPRLKGALELLERVWAGEPFERFPELEPHRVWFEDVRRRHPSLEPPRVGAVLRDEVGLVFLRVLEDAGVFKRTPEGLAAFDRFVGGL